jgi:predicted nucleic acid-binding protein
MVILDTNVVTELMKPAAEPAVIAWMNRQEASGLFLTTVSIGEILYGIRILPQGKRRLQLEQGFEAILSDAFTGRVLAFDEGAARHYGDVMGRRRELGRPLGVPDGQIASIARSNRYAVATRNVRDFVECGVEIINPFEVR